MRVRAAMASETCRTSAGDHNVDRADQVDVVQTEGAKAPEVDDGRVGGSCGQDRSRESATSVHGPRTARSSLGTPALQKKREPRVHRPGPTFAALARGSCVAAARQWISSRRGTPKDRPQRGAAEDPAARVGRRGQSAAAARPDDAPHVTVDPVPREVRQPKLVTPAPPRRRRQGRDVPQDCGAPISRSQRASAASLVVPRHNVRQASTVAASSHDPRALLDEADVALEAPEPDGPGTAWRKASPARGDDGQRLARQGLLAPRRTSPTRVAWPYPWPDT